MTVMMMDSSTSHNTSSSGDSTSAADNTSSSNNVESTSPHPVVSSLQPAQSKPSNTSTITPAIINTKPPTTSLVPFLTSDPTTTLLSSTNPKPSTVVNPSTASVIPPASSVDSYKTLLNRMSMGLIDWLKFHPNVASVNVIESKPIDRSDISNWEQKYMCILPEDLKNFYTTMNGLNLSWTVSMSKTSPNSLQFNRFVDQRERISDAAETNDQLTVGTVNVHPLQKLTKIAGNYESKDKGISLADIDSDEELLSSASFDVKSSDSAVNLCQSVCSKPTRRPKFNEKSRILELDYIDRLKARVCLVYKNTRNETPSGPNPEVWFLDRSLTWHFVAKDFTTYFRLMILHLGLPEWHFLLVGIPISHKCRQWFSFFAPIRISLHDRPSPNTNTNPIDSIGLQSSSTSTSVFDTPMVPVKFDSTRVFKAAAKSARHTKASAATVGGASLSSNQKKKSELSKVPPGGGATSVSGSGTGSRNAPPGGSGGTTRTVSAGGVARRT